MKLSLNKTKMYMLCSQYHSITSFRQCDFWYHGSTYWLEFLDPVSYCYCKFTVTAVMGDAVLHLEDDMRNDLLHIHLPMDFLIAHDMVA